MAHNRIISKIILWLAWVFAVYLVVLETHFLTANISRLNTFSKPFDAFPIGMVLMCVVAGGGLRFWLWRMRNPWLALIPFFGGLFFAWHASMLGIFLFPEFCRVFQILSGALFLAYLPLFVRRRESPPPIPKPESSPAPPEKIA